jgi:hypothetical protein
VSTVRIGEVRFRVYPQDHTPRHVHGLIGSGQVIVDLRTDGTVRLARRADAVVGVTRSEVRRVLVAAARGFDQLVAAWERMQHDTQH